MVCYFAKQHLSCIDPAGKADNESCSDIHYRVIASLCATVKVLGMVVFNLYLSDRPILFELDVVVKSLAKVQCIVRIVQILGSDTLYKDPKWRCFKSDIENCWASNGLKSFYFGFVWSVLEQCSLM